MQRWLRPQISLFLLRPDLTATLQGLAPALLASQKVSAAGSCSVATLPHSSPLPRPLAWSCWVDASVKAPLSTGKTTSSLVFPSPRDGSYSRSD